MDLSKGHSDATWTAHPTTETPSPLLSPKDRVVGRRFMVVILTTYSSTNWHSFVLGGGDERTSVLVRMSGTNIEKSI